jgi:diaminopropionate ammonia-lyase
MLHLANPLRVTTAAADTPAPDESAPAAFHAGLPGYRPTPLVRAPGLARMLGVADVLVKDESTRLGLPSFKILGASWATANAVRDAWLDAAAPLTLDALADRMSREGRGRRLVAATDGNHGRGVAWMARQLGLPCEILVPDGTTTPRIRGIEAEGAVVTVVDGTYDDAIIASAALAGPDAIVVSDTSWDGYEITPRRVVEGYSTMFGEIDDELARLGLSTPDVLALQAGVGAFAAAGLAHHWTGMAPTTVVVEPSTANCLMESARHGGVFEVPGPHRSMMAGLNCGLPSLIAWPVVSARTDHFVAIDDDVVADTMSALADDGIVSGESGAAGAAGLLAVARHDAGLAARVGLVAGATVLVVNTEGATDPDNYARVTGRQVAP